MSSETIPCPVRTNASKIPACPALTTPDRTWNWAEFAELVGLAEAFLNEVAPNGSRVGLQHPTSPESVALLLAGLRTGHVLVPLSPRLPKAALWVACRQIGVVKVLGEARGQVPIRLASSTNNPISREPAGIPLDRPATVVMTSGSTAAPKAAMLSVGNHVWSARGLAERIPLGPGDGWLLDLPLYHVSGLAIVFRCTLAGSAIVLPDGATSASEVIVRHGVTHVSVVATQLRRLLGEHRSLTLGLKAMLLGGDAVPKELMAQARARGLPVFVSYGMTEMASTVSLWDSDYASEPMTSGFVLPHREVRIQAGEIHVRGRTLFLGYADGDDVLLPVDADGWFPTGDLGAMDEQGRLVITGRKDNLFISGGENIQPEEIESALEGIKGVVRAIVVPVADEEFGFRPVAFVESEGELDRGEVRDSLAAFLPGFKLPVALFTWPENVRLKPDRRWMGEEALRLLRE